MSKPKSIRNVSTDNQQVYPDLINRRIDHKFAGHTLKLDLSLGLFSSAGIDTGSRLLLKSLAQKCSLDDLKLVLDVGCGVGTLGLSVAAYCPNAHVLLVDRDALAVVFSAHNAAINALKNVETAQRLMLEGPHLGHYDLILSNFPAKAGDLALSHFIQESAALLAPQGRGAMVIVHTLANRCLEILHAMDLNVIYCDASKNHTVFHYQTSSPSLSRSCMELLAPYIRKTSEFHLRRIRYTMDTVWNIDNFDTLSWYIELSGEILEFISKRGHWMFWSSGQGHLPTAATAKHGARPESIVLCDRDRLALKISQHNVEKLGLNIPIEIHPIPDVGDIINVVKAESIDVLITILNPVPRSEWNSRLRMAAATVLQPGGEWLIVSRSSILSELMKRLKGWKTLHDRRSRGWRTILLRRL